MKLHKAVTYGLLAALSCGSLQAQEATAGNIDVANESMNFSMMADARFAALTSILSKLTICNAKRKFYSPSASVPAADTDGCAAADVVSTTTPTGIPTPPYQVLTGGTIKTMFDSDFEVTGTDKSLRAIKLVKLPTGYFNYANCASREVGACTVIGSATGGWNVVDKGNFSRCVVQCK